MCPKSLIFLDTPYSGRFFLKTKTTRNISCNSHTHIVRSINVVRRLGLSTRNPGGAYTSILSVFIAVSVRQSTMMVDRKHANVSVTSTLSVYASTELPRESNECMAARFPYNTRRADFGPYRLHRLSATWLLRLLLAAAGVRPAESFAGAYCFSDSRQRATTTTTTYATTKTYVTANGDGVVEFSFAATVFFRVTDDDETPALSDTASVYNTSAVPR